MWLLPRESEQLLGFRGRVADLEPGAVRFSGLKSDQNSCKSWYRCVGSFQRPGPSRSSQSDSARGTCK